MEGEEERRRERQIFACKEGARCRCRRWDADKERDWTGGPHQHFPRSKDPAQGVDRCCKTDTVLHPS